MIISVSARLSWIVIIYYFTSSRVAKFDRKFLYNSWCLYGSQLKMWVVVYHIWGGPTGSDVTGNGPDRKWRHRKSRD